MVVAALAESTSRLIGDGFRCNSRTMSTGLSNALRTCRVGLRSVDEVVLKGTTSGNNRTRASSQYPTEFLPVVDFSSIGVHDICPTQL